MTASPTLTPRPGLHLQYLDSIRGVSALYVAACHAYLMYAADFMAAGGLRFDFGSAAPRHVVADVRPRGRHGVHRAVGLLPDAPGRPIAWPGEAIDLLAVHGTQGTAHPAALLRRAGRGRRRSSSWCPAWTIPRSVSGTRAIPALSTGSVVSHLLLLHNYFPAYQYAIDHPLWSIATEWQIYFLFPLLVWIGKRQGDFSIVVTAGAITLALNLYLLNFWPQHNPWPPQFVGLFGFGMACAAWNFPGEASALPLDAGRWRRQAIVLLGAGAVATVVFAATSQQQIPDLLIGGGIGCAMVFLTNAVVDGIATAGAPPARAARARAAGCASRTACTSCMRRCWPCSTFWPAAGAWAWSNSSSSSSASHCPRPSQAATCSPWPSSVRS